MSDYVRDLEAELLRVGRQRQRRRSRFRRGPGLPLPWGGVLSGVGAVAGVAVVLAAIILLGHGARRRTGEPLGRATAARLSVARLAVLHRPQTATDRAGTSALESTIRDAAGPGQKLEPALTRLLATLPEPGAKTAGSSSPRQRVFIIVAAPRRGQGPAYPSVMSVNTARSGRPPSAVSFTRASPFPASAGGYDTAIVPDAVTRVRWTLENGGGGHHRGQTTTVYPTIHDNLASAAVSPSQGEVMHVTWYGAHGQVLKTVTGPSRQATLIYRRPTRPPAVVPAPENGRILAQTDLRAPAGRHSGRAGLATLFRHAGTLTLRVTAHGLAPNSQHGAYAIWLYRSPNAGRLVGFVDPSVRQDGTFTATGALPTDSARYHRVLITRQSTRRDTSRGDTILAGELPRR